MTLEKTLFLTRNFLYASAFFALIFSFSTFLFAQSNERDIFLPELYIADVDFDVDDENNTVSGTFELESQDPDIVAGIDYVVSVLSPLSEIPEGELIGDDPDIYSYEYVSAGLTMSPEQTRTVSFSHRYDAIPEGEYRIRIQLITSNGRELRWADRDFFVFSGQEVPFALVEPRSVLVESISPFEEDPQPRNEWDPLEGVNVDPASEVTLQAHAQNLTEAPLMGSYQLRFVRDLTTNADFQVQTLDSLQLGPVESVESALSFTAPEEPGAYQLFLEVHDESGRRVSTIAEYRLVVRGASASVVSAFAEELRLSQGDPVVISVTTVGSADATTQFDGRVVVTMLDDGVEVGSAGTGASFSAIPTNVQASVVLERDIANDPTARIDLLDDQGNVLDTYELTFSRDDAIATQASRDVRFPLMLIVGLVVLLLAALVLFFVYRSRNGSAPPTSYTAAMILLVVAMGMMGAHHVGATHERFDIERGFAVVRGNQGHSLEERGFGVTAVVNEPRPRSTHIRGESMLYSGSATYTACANRVNYAQWEVRIAQPQGGWVTDHTETTFIRRLGDAGLHGGETFETRSRHSRTMKGYIPLGQASSFYENDRTTIWSNFRMRHADWSRILGIYTPIHVISPPPTVGPTLTLAKRQLRGASGAARDLRFRLEVRNTSDAEAADVVITDRIPDGLALNTQGISTSSACTQEGRNVVCRKDGPLKGYRLWAVEVSFDILSEDKCGDFTNSASVTTSSPNADLSNNTARESVSIPCDDPSPGHGLTLEKTLLTRDPLMPGGEARFLVNVRNNGTASAEDIVIRDRIPNGLELNRASSICSQEGRDVVCRFDSAAPPGGNRGAFITFDIPSTFTCPSSFVNTARATATSRGENVSLNTSTSDLQVQCPENGGREPQVSPSVRLEGRPDHDSDAWTRRTVLVREGEPTVLSWSTEDVKSCQLRASGGLTFNTNVDLQQSRTRPYTSDPVSEETTFTLTCQASDDSTSRSDTLRATVQSLDPGHFQEN